MNKVKEQAKNVADSGKRIVSNSEQFVQAVSLLVVAGFSYWAIQRVELGQVAYWTVLAALVVIGIRGAFELLRFLDKK